MKLFVKFIVLATLAVIVQETLAGEEFLKKAEVCRDKLGITSEEAEEAHKAFENGSDIPEKSKCFANCMAKEVGVLDSNGKFDVEKMQSMHSMEDDHVEKVKDCKAKHDDEEEECEYALKMMFCVMEK